jgi:hypothetical protein
MSLPVSEGEKFALVAVHWASPNLSQPLDLGDGFFAADPQAIVLAPHWREWIGSLKSDSINRASILLGAKMASKRPGVLDHENIALDARVSDLFLGVLLAGRVWITEVPTRLSGALVKGELGVRSLGDSYHVEGAVGLPLPKIDEAHLRRAAFLAQSMRALFGEQGMMGVKRALSTFLVAFRELDISERIHQFVRSVDGVTRSWRGEQFKERCRILVGTGQGKVCRDLYTVRSNAEHFNDPDKNLDKATAQDAIVRAFRFVHVAEALARNCLVRVVADRSLWPHFKDDASVEAFWALPESDRAKLWGAPLDVATALAGFDPQHVLDRV